MLPRMRALTIVLFAQAMLRPPGAARPTAEQLRKEMGIPSTGDLRGQLDNVGYGSKPEQMAKAWAVTAPPADAKGPAPGVLGAIAPHDDWVFTARVDRQILPLVTAKTVIAIGAFHQHRKLRMRDQLVFDDYRAWRAPDGEIAISPLRDELFAALPKGEAVRDDAAHDSEHSIEAMIYWVKHARPDVELVPIIVPAMSFARAQALASHLSAAIAASMKKRGLVLGRDLAILISTDGTHYGEDFKHTPFGAGGWAAYEKAVAFDKELIAKTLTGAISTEKAKTFFTTMQSPDKPDEIHNTWCGRFSIPLGLLVLDGITHGKAEGVPVALGDSVNAPEVPLRDVGLAATNPSNLFHFVTHPAIAFVPAK
jgi:AmmeMemoRadiSam system protein B